MVSSAKKYQHCLSAVIAFSVCCYLSCDGNVSEISSCILPKNCLLNHVVKGNIEGGLEMCLEDEEEDVSSSWITLTKIEGTGN